MQKRKHRQKLPCEHILSLISFNLTSFVFYDQNILMWYVDYFIKLSLKAWTNKYTYEDYFQSIYPSRT